MLRQEAEWLRDRLAELTELSPLLDLGSSTESFRRVEQPYIEGLVMAPLAARGCRIVHVDAKDAPGVDLRADLMNDEDLARLRAQNPRSLLCANMLEHLPDPAAALRRLLSILPPGGTLLLTVPRSFPFHADPIDTLFRPSPRQLRALLGDRHEIRHCEVVTGSTLLGELRYRRSLRRDQARGTAAPGRFRLQTLRHLGWLWRPYRITCAVVVKRGESG